MLGKFIAWWVGSWAVLEVLLGAALWLFGISNGGFLLFFSLLLGLVAVMVAAGQCGGPPSSQDRHGLKRW